MFAFGVSLTYFVLGKEQTRQMLWVEGAADDRGEQTLAEINQLISVFGASQIRKCAQSVGIARLPEGARFTFEPLDCLKDILLRR